MTLLTAEDVVGVAGVTKRFGGQTALDSVDLSVRPGSIHALAGENGAGKSTLIKILAGVYEPDEGAVFARGQEVTLRGPRDARALNFAFLHQQLNLIPTMDVRENLFLTSAYPRRAGVITWGEIDRDARDQLQRVGLDVSPQDLIRDLSPAQQQLVALARVLLEKPTLIVLDEPTASLGAEESEHLLKLVKEQVQAGATVIFVSHRIDEMLRICDTITVLRDGRVVATLPVSDISRDQLVHLLGGAAEHDEHLGGPVTRAPVPRLELTDLTIAGLDNPSTLHVDPGEVVGLAGLVGSGRTTLLTALAGGGEIFDGLLRLDGHPLELRNRRAARVAGLVHVPEDRSDGIIPDFGIPENVSLGHVERYSWHKAIISMRREREAAARLSTALEIRRGKGDDRIRFLSGGNQQKVLLARALDIGPSVLLLDEPTAGIDIATKEYIYKLIRQLAADGISVLFVSSDLDELPLVCDRILVFKRGAVIRELPGTTSRAVMVSHLFAKTETDVLDTTNSNGGEEPLVTDGRANGETE